MNLTDVIALLKPSWAHRIMAFLGIDQEAFHAWLEGFCPCGAASPEGPSVEAPCAQSA